MLDDPPPSVRSIENIGAWTRRLRVQVESISQAELVRQFPWLEPKANKLKPGKPPYWGDDTPALAAGSARRGGP